MIEKKPFTKMHLDEENKRVDTFTIRLNTEERKEFDEYKKLIQQKKDSTAFKQLAVIGAKTTQRQEVKEILGIVQGNKRRNKRLGIADFE